MYIYIYVYIYIYIYIHIHKQFISEVLLPTTETNKLPPSPPDLQRHPAARQGRRVHADAALHAEPGGIIIVNIVNAIVIIIIITQSDIQLN